MNARLDSGRHLLCCLACTLTAIPAHALQLLHARDGSRVEAVIALKEPTRIRIERAAITDVFGNLYSSNCNAPAAIGGVTAVAAPVTPAILNPAGEIALECHRDKGEIFVRPVGRSAKPINLFIASAQATYTLLLRRADVPADTIVIRDTSTRARPTDAPGALPAEAPRPANPFRAMKALLVAMATERPGADIRVSESNRTIPLWAEARLSLLRTYHARDLIGEKYLLTNISGQPMVLAEQEFDRAGQGIVAIAIENLNLRPGDATSVYLIRQGT